MKPGQKCVVTTTGEIVNLIRKICMKGHKITWICTNGKWISEHWWRELKAVYDNDNGESK